MHFSRTKRTWIQTSKKNKIIINLDLNEDGERTAKGSAEREEKPIKSAQGSHYNLQPLFSSSFYLYLHLNPWRKWIRLSRPQSMQFKDKRINQEAWVSVSLSPPLAGSQIAMNSIWEMQAKRERKSDWRKRVSERDRVIFIFGRRCHLLFDHTISLSLY